MSVGLVAGEMLEGWVRIAKGFLVDALGILSGFARDSQGIPKGLNNRTELKGFACWWFAYTSAAKRPCSCFKITWRPVCMWHWLPVIGLVACGSRMLTN